MVGFNPNMQCLMMKSNHGNLAGDTKQQFDVSLLAVKYLQSMQQLCNDKALLQYLSHLLVLRSKFYSKIIGGQIVLSPFTRLTCKNMASEAVNYDAGKMIVFAQFTITGSWEIAAMVQRDAEVKVIEITPNLNNYELTPTENSIIQSVFNTEGLEIISNENLQVL